MQPAPPEPKPYEARLLDMQKLVQAHDPYAPVPWRVRPFVIDQTLAIVAGKGGAGKTWVIHEAANAVQRGSTTAGMTGTTGTSLIIDAEMGQYLTVKRFAEQNYSTDIQVFDAGGMDLKSPEHRQMVRDVVMDLKPSFVGFDSLRALVPSAKENDSDDMGPVVTWMRWLIRTSGAAGMLIHHAGWKEDRTRGSSAIKDQADTVWYMSIIDDEGGRKLSCRGADLKSPRWSEPPDDIFVQIKKGGGLGGSEAPIDRQAQVTERIIGAVREGTFTSANKIMESLGESKSGAARNALKTLMNDQVLEQVDGVFRIAAAPGPAI